MEKTLRESGKPLTGTAIWCLIFAVGIHGCAQSPPETVPEPEAVAAHPLPGTNYVVTYLRGASVWTRDTRTGTDLQITIGGGSTAEFRTAAPGRSFAAIRTDGTSGLYAVTASSDSARLLHPGGAGTYSFAWSPDGTRLAFGFRPEAGNGSRGIWIVSASGAPRRVGCRAADRVHAWRGQDGLLVGDAANVYTVNADSCSTLATLPRQGKAGFAFASTGRRLSFQRRTSQGPELYLANHDGSGSQKIADAQVNPRNARWAPDGSKVAFEIDSPRFANRTHVAIHDVAARRVSYNDRETPLGVPNEGNACWSPDSRRVLFDRIYDRSDGTQTYQTRQKVVKTGTTESVVHEELRREGVSVSENPCRWLDEQHVLITGNDGYLVLNVDTRTDFLIGDAHAVLFVHIYD